MQTTLRLNDVLYREAKTEAVREGITITNFIEDALRLRLEQKQRTSFRGTKVRLPIFKGDTAGSFPYSPSELKRLQQQMDQTWDRDKAQKTS